MKNLTDCRLDEMIKFYEGREVDPANPMAYIIGENVKDLLMAEKARRSASRGAKDEK